jgi:hypothetical protein
MVSRRHTDSASWNDRLLHLQPCLSNDHAFSGGAQAPVGFNARLGINLPIIGEIDLALVAPYRGAQA